MVTDKPRTLEKIIITILAIAFTIWIGGTLIRGTIAYDIFEPGTRLVLKQNYDQGKLFYNSYIYASSSLYTTVSYLVVFICAIFLNVLGAKGLRQRGWLFMALALFYISAPMEFINIYYDIKLSMDIFFGGVNDFASWSVQHWYLGKLKSVTLSTLSGIAFLANITALVFIIWKPLNKIEN